MTSASAHREDRGDAGEAADRKPRDTLGAPTPDDDDPTVNLGRIAWSITTLVFAIAALVLLLDGYDGYASVTFAVAVAAGINLV
jgi:hypothetical protein